MAAREFVSFTGIKFTTPAKLRKKTVNEIFHTAPSPISGAIRPARDFTGDAVVARWSCCRASTRDEVLGMIRQVAAENPDLC